MFINFKKNFQYLIDHDSLFLHIFYQIHTNLDIYLFYTELLKRVRDRFSIYFLIRSSYEQDIVYMSKQFHVNPQTPPKALGAIVAAPKAVTRTLLQEPGATPWRSRAVGNAQLHMNTLCNCVFTI